MDSAALDALIDAINSGLTALERLVLAKGLTDETTLAAREQAWIGAYRHTPHGKPVELAPFKP